MKRWQVLEAAKKYRSPVMIQFSFGGAQFLAGKSLDNPKDTLDACVLGAIAVRFFPKESKLSLNFSKPQHAEHRGKLL